MKQHITDDFKRMVHFALMPLIAGCFFTRLTVAQCEAQTVPDTTVGAPAFNPDSPEATSGSALREEIRRLRFQAAALRRHSAALRNAPDSSSITDDTTPPAPEAPALDYQLQPAPRIKDTVQLLSKESAELFLESIRGRKRSTRQRGYGGAIGPALGVYAIAMGPVDNLIRFMGNNSDFSQSHISTDKPFALFQCSGITGYGAIGNGLRIGGCFMGGSRRYTNFIGDTTYNLEINPSFGGFLLEKAVVLENTNIYWGGLIGGASIKVRPSKTTNALTSISVDSENFRINFNELTATSLLLELHGGFTYTMINWFHIGADLSAPLFFSNSGFTTSGGHSITNGFISVNPGIRIRIMIGNIG